MNTEGLVNQVNLLNTYVRALESEKSSLQFENEKLHRQIYNLVQTQEKLLAELNTAKDKNHDLLRDFANQAEELKKIKQIQRLLFEKQRQLLLASQQKKKLQEFLSRKEGKIQQLQTKIKSLEEGFGRQRASLKQMLQDLKNEKAKLLDSLADQKDKVVGKLTSEVQRKASQLSKSNLELMKQKQKFSEQINFLSKNINQLTERYSEAEKANKKYQSKILALQKNSTELQAQTRRQRVLLKQYETTYTSLFTKTEGYNITIEKLQSELKEVAKVKAQDNQRFVSQMKQVQREKDEMTKQKEELQKKNCQLLNQKQLLSRANSQRDILICQLQNKHNYANLQLQQLKQKSEKTQELLKRKINVLQQQLVAIENQVSSAKVTAMAEHQTKNQKEIELNALKNIISEKQKFIAQQKQAFAKICDLLSSKEKEIQNLQANNSMLRKQVLTVLANEDASRKEMLLQKQNSTALLRKSRASETNLLQGKRSNAGGKRYTGMLTQCSAEAGFRRSTLSKLNYLDSKNTCQSLVEETMGLIDENDCQDV